MTDSPNLALAEEIDAFDFEGWDVSTRELLKLSSLLARAAALLRAQPSGDWVMALERIAALDPNKDSDEGFNEWGEAHCFRQAQEIAKAALSAAKERG